MAARRWLRIGCGGLIALGGLGVGALIAVPALYGPQIAQGVVDQANAQLNATLEVGTASLSIWESFPSATVVLTEVRLVNKAPFEGTELFTADRVAISADLMSAMGKGPIRITGLSLDQPSVNVKVDAEGNSNTDIMVASATAEAPAAEAGPTPELWLRDLAITGLDLSYDDVPGGIRATITELDLKGDAEVGSDVVALRTSGGAQALSARMGGVDYLKEAKVSTTLDLRYGPLDGAMRFGDSKVSVNALAVDFKGDVLPDPAGTRLDMAFSTNEATFKQVLSLIPAAYTSGFDQVDTDGTFNLKGKVAGLLPDEGEALPSMDLALNISKGRFKYPDLPAGIDGIELDLALKHPGGAMDLVTIDIPRFAMNVDGSPFVGRLAIKTPTTDPWVDTEVKGAIDLGTLWSTFPPDGTSATGQLLVDLALKGSASDFEKVDVDRVSAKGSIKLVNMVYTDPEQPVPFNIDSLQVSLDPRSLDLAEFRLRFGRSDIAASGAVQNALGYALAGQTLKGSFDVSSRYLDSTPWEGEDADDSGTIDPDESYIYPVPEDLDLSLSLDFKQVKTKDYALENLRGGATVKDGVLRFNKLKAQTLGGRVGLDGTYAAKTDRKADLDLNIEVEDLAVSETVATFTTITKALPIAEKSSGRLSSGFNLKTSVGPDLTPDLITLFSSGSMSTKGTSISPAFLEPVAKFTGNKGWDTLDLDPAGFGFEVDGGRLNFDAIPIKLGTATGALMGSSGVLDHKLDLTLDLSVPADQIKGGDALSSIVGEVKSLGLKAKIGGTWDKPSVKVTVGDALKDQLTDALAAKVDAVVDDALALAKAQGDKLVAEAEKQAERLRTEGYAAAERVRDEAKKQGNKLKKEAKGNPLKEAAADKAADVLKKEANKTAKKLEGEADKNADKLVSGAKDQRTKLIGEAESKAGR